MSAGLAVPARSATSDIVCHSHSLISRWELVFPSILPCLVARDVICMVSATSREEMVFTANSRVPLSVVRVSGRIYGAGSLEGAGAGEGCIPVSPLSRPKTCPTLRI